MQWRLCFPNCPAYLSSAAAASRTTTRASSTSRLCTVLDYFVSQLVSYILFLQQKTCFNLHAKDSLVLVDACVMVAVLAVVDVVVVDVALVHAGVSAKRYYHALHSVTDMLILFCILLDWDCVFIRFINSKLNVPPLRFIVKLNQKTN